MFSIFNRKKKIKVIPFEGSTFTGKVNNEKKLKKGFDIKWDPDGYRYDWGGNGVLTYEDGSTYEGTIKCGKYNGKGKRIYPSEEDDEFVSYYNGDWVDGIQHGQGTYLHQSGWKYEGSWVNGVMSGIGKFYFHDGTIYKGDVENNNMNGTGKYYRIVNLMTDKRKLVVNKSNIYVGQWVDGVFNGQGTYYHLNQKPWYVGHWRNGVCHGSGMTFNEAGELIEHGEYSNGELIEQQYDVTKRRHTVNIPMLDLTQCIDDEDNKNSKDKNDIIIGATIHTPVHKLEKVKPIKNIPAIRRIKRVESPSPRTPRMCKPLIDSNVNISGQSKKKPIKTVSKNKATPKAPVKKSTSKWGWIGSIFSVFSRSNKKNEIVVIGNPVNVSSVSSDTLIGNPVNVSVSSNKPKPKPKPKANPKVSKKSQETLNMAFGISKKRENAYRVSTPRIPRNTKDRVLAFTDETKTDTKGNPPKVNTSREKQKKPRVSTPRPSTPRTHRKKTSRGSISMLNPLECIREHPKRVDQQRIREWGSSSGRRRRVSLAGTSSTRNKPPKGAPIKQIKRQADTFDSLELLKLVNRSNYEIQKHFKPPKKVVKTTNPLVRAGGALAL